MSTLPLGHPPLIAHDPTLPCPECGHELKAHVRGKCRANVRGRRYYSPAAGRHKWDYRKCGCGRRGPADGQLMMEFDR